MDALEDIVQEGARMATAVAVATEEQQTTLGSLDARMARLTRIGQASAWAAKEPTITMIELSHMASEARGAAEKPAGARG